VLVRIRPLADRDIDGQVAYLAQEAGETVALRFLDAMERTFSTLAEQPALGSLRLLDETRLEGTRVLPVAGFRKVLVFYVTSGDTIEVLRVLHGARDIPPLLEEG
jgi:toxin ParE1/3/4